MGKVRRCVANDFEAAFGQVDVLITPAAPHVAPTVQRVHELSAAEMYASDVMTVPASLAGLPAMSIPAGMAEGLPVGVQLIGRQNSDAKLLGLAAAVESQL